MSIGFLVNGADVGWRKTATACGVQYAVGLSTTREIVRRQITVQWQALVERMVFLPEEVSRKNQRRTEIQLSVAVRITLFILIASEGDAVCFGSQRRRKLDVPRSGA
jgi:hypothetical protein